ARGSRASIPNPRTRAACATAGTFARTEPTVVHAVSASNGTIATATCSEAGPPERRSERMKLRQPSVPRQQASSAFPRG
ncbi:MAG: hypothetical protein ACKV2Q_29025, partial [Planctomycetaceae bacterium]